MEQARGFGSCLGALVLTFDVQQVSDGFFVARMESVLAAHGQCDA